MNKESNIKERLRQYKAHPKSLVVMLLVMLATVMTFAVLIGIIAYILINGLPYINSSIFEFKHTSENASLMPALINTLIMTLISLVIAVPLGIFAAIFLVEYASRGNKLLGLIRLTTETLSGIPSIVYGLFGLLFFVDTLGWGFSMIAGAFTLAIMILPLIIRTTEEALKSVPNSFREGSFGLGAGKLRTVFKIVLPSAVPGILAGIILPSSIMGSGRTLAVHMYTLASEGLYMNQAYATAVVILVMTVGINTLSSVVARRLVKN